MKIETDQINDYFDRFCDHMKLNRDRWGSIFEFSAYIGFWPLNATMMTIRRGGTVVVPDRATTALNQLSGQHAAALLKAYSYRRYSPWGRIKTAGIKFCHAVGFVGAIVIGLAFEIWGDLCGLMKSI